MTRRASSPDPAAPSPTQLWTAAQRLATGDSPAMAAAMAEIAYATLIDLIADRDVGFAELCEDCRRVHDMAPEETEARMSRMALDSAERLMMAGNATVTLRFLRDDPTARTSRRESALIQSNQNMMRMMHTLTAEKLAEFQGLGRFLHEEAAANDPHPPQDTG